jgi:hypothetical protein
MVTIYVSHYLSYSYQVDFGDTSSLFNDGAIIFGTVFYDENGNGIQDMGELGREGVTIALSGSTSATTSTNQFGQYVFPVSQAGVYTVTEDGAPSYSTTPDMVNFEVVLGNSYSLDFGDYGGSPSIYGTVFNDRNGNGIQDAGETGIAGVQITLSGSTNATAYTNQFGQYTFPVYQAGIYTITETDLGDFKSTTANMIYAYVSFGHSYLLNFGDSYIVSTTTTTVQPTTSVPISTTSSITTTVPTTTTISTTTIEVSTSTTPNTTTTIVIDSDNDGVPDTEDNCPSKPNGPILGTCTPSSDSPGITCTSDADCVIGCSTNGKCSLNQEDTDSDGKGDVCDNCPTTCNPLQSDANGNGIGDLCDPNPECGGCDQPQCEQGCSPATSTTIP